MNEIEQFSGDCSLDKIKVIAHKILKVKFTIHLKANIKLLQSKIEQESRHFSNVK